MHNTNLRKVGGSIMLAVPPALLDVLHLGPGSVVGMAVDNGRLIVKPQNQPRYTLSELLAKGGTDIEMSNEEKLWLGSNPTGNEAL